MTKNKDKRKLTLVSSNQGDAGQVQSLVEQYHEVAQGLRGSSNQRQAEVALEDITGETEIVQLSLIKMLAHRRDTDAADVLLALNVLSPLKTVRKEARRGLFQLEQGKITPRWEPVLEHTSPLQALQAQTQAQAQARSNPPRFWKSFITDSLASGEVSMVLFWEQGEEYREVRSVGFLLDFWDEGIKDFFTDLLSKRQAQKMIAANIQTGQFIPCSLAKGKRLLLKALAIHEEKHTAPSSDYSEHLALVNELILEVPDVGEETEEEQAEERIASFSRGIDLTTLTPTEVAINFIEAWTHANFALAYELLAADSPLRQGLSLDAWAERRERLAEHSQPHRLKPGFVREHKAATSGLWLPPGGKRRSSYTSQEYEAGWSIELADPSSIQQLPELPAPSLVYKDGGRYWFWATFTFTRKQDRWFIQDIADEAARTRALSIPQIERKIEEMQKESEKLVKKTRPQSNISEGDALSQLSDVINVIQSVLSYEDAIVLKSESTVDQIMNAFDIAVSLFYFDRAISYLDIALERFPEHRADVLEARGTAQINLLNQYIQEYNGELEDEEELDEDKVEADELDEDELDEIVARLRKQAIADFQESLASQESARLHILIAGLLSDSDNDEDIAEAETHLHRAEQLDPVREETMTIEGLLGSIARSREQYEQALGHYRRAAEIDPTIHDIWHKIGDLYLDLHKDSEAEASFKKSLELEPDNLTPYSHLVELYLAAGRIDNARELLEQGLVANPDEPYLMALLSSVYYEQGEFDQANEILTEAEEIDPDLDIVQQYREIMNRLDEKRSKQK